jgi:hypothetical protein
MGAELCRDPGSKAESRALLLAVLFGYFQRTFSKCHLCS